MSGVFGIFETLATCVSQLFTDEGAPEDETKCSPFRDPSTVYSKDQIETGLAVIARKKPLQTELGDKLEKSACKVNTHVMGFGAWSFAVDTLSASIGKNPRKCLLIGDDFDSISTATYRSAFVFAGIFSTDATGLEITCLTPHNIDRLGRSERVQFMPDSHRTLAQFIATVLKDLGRFDSLYAIGSGGKVVEVLCKDESYRPYVPDSLIFQQPRFDNAIELDAHLVTMKKSVMVIYPHNSEREKVFPKLSKFQDADLAEYVYTSSETTTNVDVVGSDYEAMQSSLSRVLALRLTRPIHPSE